MAENLNHVMMKLPEIYLLDCTLNDCDLILKSVDQVLVFGPSSLFYIMYYCRLNYLRASVFQFERLDILRDSIGHPSKKLLSFEFDQSFNIQFRASRYITGLNLTCEKKVFVV